MLKKELRDTVHRFSECLLILLVLPIAYLMDRLLIHYFAPFWELLEGLAFVACVAFAVYAGATLFQSEKRDQAFEYLLSLPLTRWKILRSKLLPRLLFVLALALIQLLWHGPPNGTTIAFALIVLFLASAFLSLPVDSVIVAFLGVFLLYTLFGLVAQMLYHLMIYLWREHGSLYNPQDRFSSYVIAALLVLVPLGISFWKSFRDFDLKPLRFQLRPYLTIALPSILVLLILAVAFFNVYFGQLVRQL